MKRCAPSTAPRHRSPRPPPRSRPAAPGTSAAPGARRRDRRPAAPGSRTRPRAARSCRRPGAERISRRPPSSRARSSIEVRPRWRERSSGCRGSNPAPSSVTSSTSGLSRTSMWPARAWRSALCSASWTIRSGQLAPPSPVTRRRRRSARSQRRGPGGASRPPCAASARAVALELGRAQAEDQRAQLLERLAGELAEALHLPAAGGGIAVEGVAAASAVRTRLKSFWLTASWSSSASRLRSETIESSRLARTASRS